MSKVNGDTPLPYTGLTKRELFAAMNMAAYISSGKQLRCPNS